MGEVTAAVVAGALTPAEGFRVIARRSQLMSRRAETGAIALLELDAPATEALIADTPEVTVAVYASPRQTVVAGPTEAVDAVVARATAQNTFARRVNVDVASHHAMMDPILPELRDALADLVPGFPVIPIISTVENAGDAPEFDADHWVANLRNPVRFSDAIATAGATNSTFIEISPHPLLTKAISDTLDDPDTGNKHHHSLGTLQRDTNDTVAFHTSLNATFTARPPVGEHPPEPHPSLPTIPRGATPGIGSTSVPALSANSFGAGNSRPPTVKDSPVPADWLYATTWPSRSLSEGHAASTGSWLVLKDDELAAELGCGPIDSVDHVLYAPATDSSSIDVARPMSCSTTPGGSPGSSTSLTQPPKLFFLTRNAQPVAEGDRANPAHAVLWGLGRTLALEHPEIWGGVIDVDESMPAVLVARHVPRRGGGR